MIDFGLAKAMHQSLTEKTLYTAHEMVLGTPLYMSPEQAQLNNLDVDTRADIYSLGVLLYELLTGTTPLERKRFKEAAWDEIRRMIREEEPPRPSMRLSSTDTLPSLATFRHTEPAKLKKLVRGELDWIVMKALEKDRTRRYETANGLARDIQRYLDDEVVEAASSQHRLPDRQVRSPAQGAGDRRGLGVVCLAGRDRRHDLGVNQGGAMPRRDWRNHSHESRKRTLIYRPPTPRSRHAMIWPSMPSRHSTRG